MGKLKILAKGNSKKDNDNKRGKLFEKLMSETLRQLGYEIDKIPNTNYAGMEIDIEGKSIVGNIPLYAECKCYENSVDSSKFQQFIGKFHSRWLSDNRSVGLFIVIPNVNSHVKGDYKEKYENNKEFIIEIIEEDLIINYIYKAKLTNSVDQIIEKINKQNFQTGDWTLYYTEEGIFWSVFLIPKGYGIPNGITILNSKGDYITDKKSIAYLQSLDQEIKEFNIIDLSSSENNVKEGQSDLYDEIVEVKGSSSAFEYHFPASPEYFIGREHLFEQIDKFVDNVIFKNTSARGLLFEGQSGWGKSSLVLSSVSRLNKRGHFAFAIDSRSASSIQFILKVISYLSEKLKEFNYERFKDLPKITGFDGAIKVIKEISKIFDERDLICLIFFDQFENLFYSPEILKKIQTFYLKICEIQSNFIFGFSWKFDLIGLTSEFPYIERDTIINYSQIIRLDLFTESEINLTLNALEKEIKTKIRKDLKFFLFNLSQGYPWLLIRLCAQVRTKIELKTNQIDIVDSLLKPEELFLEDLRNLTSEEEDFLRRIAKKAPVPVSVISEEFRPDILQTLINKRLIVRIGSIYDIYWDIFRDYLNSGNVPFQENYILKMGIRTIVKSFYVLKENPDSMTEIEYKIKLGYKEKTCFNVLRDMKLLNLIKYENEIVKPNVIYKDNDIEESIRFHIRERLLRNRLIKIILFELEQNKKIEISDLSVLLEKSNPYISATRNTWDVYSRNIADWIDASGLAKYDYENHSLMFLEETNQYTRKKLFPKKQRKGRRPTRSYTYPTIQYRPIIKMLRYLVENKTENNQIDLERENFEDISKNTKDKTIPILVEMDFISKNENIVKINAIATEFYNSNFQRTDIFLDKARKYKSFRIFCRILEKNRNRRLTLHRLGNILANSLKVDWTDNTRVYNAKILLDWSKNLNLVPDVYKNNLHGRLPIKRPKSRKISEFTEKQK